MQFQAMGRISSSIKNMELKMEWNERKRDPNKAKGKEKKTTETSQIDLYKQQAESARKQQAISAIEGKMKAGMQLSGADMDYLREHAPQLHEKAVAIAKEREEYRRELEKCRSKEDVEKLRMRKMQMFASEVQAISNNSEIPKEKKLELITYVGMRVMSTMNEHTEFTQTPEYKSLPDRTDDNEGEERRVREEPTFDDAELTAEIEALKRKYSSNPLGAGNGAVEPGTAEPAQDAPAEAEGGEPVAETAGTNGAAHTAGQAGGRVYNAKGAPKAASPHIGGTGSGTRVSIEV